MAWAAPRSIIKNAFGLIACAIYAFLELSFVSVGWTYVPTFSLLIIFNKIDGVWLFAIMVGIPYCAAINEASNFVKIPPRLIELKLFFGNLFFNSSTVLTLRVW